MTRFWESRKTSTLPGSRLAHYYHGGILYALALDAAGDISLHLIEENENPNCAENLIAETGCTNAGEMLFDVPFVLVPEAFEKSRFEGFPGLDVLSFTVEKGMHLQIAADGGRKCFHAAIPLYHIAKKNAEAYEYFVYTAVLQNHCLVHFFRNGKCELANVFPARNESEVLYFSVAPIKKAGLNVDQVRFEFLAEADETTRILKTADRFLPHASISRIELPYPAGEYPPYAHIAFLLYQFLQCELPEVS